jgi:hypothetical protein
VVGEHVLEELGAGSVGNEGGDEDARSRTTLKKPDRRRRRR